MITQGGPCELLSNVIERGLCIGCGACIGLCPYFRSYRGKTAMLFPCDASEGRCFDCCPRVEVDLDELSRQHCDVPYRADPLGHYRSIHTAQAGGKVGEGPFQAGGTVSAVVSFALERGYLDGVVLTDREGLLPVPRCVTTPGEVLRCGTSKYTAAPTLSAVNRAMSDGYRRIGAVTTPCQAQALALMQSRRREEHDGTDPVQLVVGIFCTWSLDFRAFEAFIADRIPVDSIAMIDIPPPPAEIMEIHLTDGSKQELPLDAIRELVPPGCSYCLDMTAEFTDISVGVLEGRPDMNTLIIRTERGQRLVDEAVDAGYLIVGEMDPDARDHLAWAAGRKKGRALVRAADEGVLNGENGDRRAVMRLSERVVQSILAAQRGCA